MSPTETMPSFLNRSSGKLLTVFQGDGSGEGIKDESEDQGNDRENTYEDIPNDFHTLDPSATKG
jgi:hypothetical protein